MWMETGEGMGGTGKRKRRGNEDNGTCEMYKEERGRGEEMKTGERMNGSGRRNGR